MLGSDIYIWLSLNFNKREKHALKLSRLKPDPRQIMVTIRLLGNLTHLS